MESAKGGDSAVARHSTCEDSSEAAVTAQADWSSGTAAHTPHEMLETAETAVNDTPNAVEVPLHVNEGGVGEQGAKGIASQSMWQLTADEEQLQRFHAYDAASGVSTLEFLREARHVIMPDGINHLIDGSTDIVARGASHIAEGVRNAAKAASNTIGAGAGQIGQAIDAVPTLLVNAIPASVMSVETKSLLFGDFSNTLRCFFHTNILSAPFIFQKAGLVGGILLLSFVAVTSAYATEAYFGAKNQMKLAHTVVVYGDVPNMVWGTWYPMINIFYGVSRLVSFLAFVASNVVVLLGAIGLHGAGAKAIAYIVPSAVVLPLVLMKRASTQAPLAVLSNVLVLTSVVMMFAYFPYNSAHSVKLWPLSAKDYFLALGVAVYAFTGIGSAIAVERTMPPRRYVRLLRVAVAVSYTLLMAFGLAGFLSYGSRTCSVMTVSLQAGGMKTAISAVLCAASLAIIPQQTFPVCELCDRRLLGIRRLTTYYEWRPNLLRVGMLVSCSFAAWVLPYYGLILSIAGALGCGVVGLVVPAALDYVRRLRWGLRRGRHLRWWEYILVFGLGVYGCTVVVIGVTFGLYQLWIAMQTNSSASC